MILKSMLQSGHFFEDFSVFIPIFAGVLTGGFHVLIHLTAFNWLKVNKMGSFEGWLLGTSAVRILLTVSIILAFSIYFKSIAWLYILSVIGSYAMFLVLKIRYLQRNLDHNTIPNA
jgi:hypothetical protein